jgi:hypothetical protein
VPCIPNRRTCLWAQCFLICSGLDGILSLPLWDSKGNARSCSVQILLRTRSSRLIVIRRSNDELNLKRIVPLFYSCWLGLRVFRSVQACIRRGRSCNSERASDGRHDRVPDGVAPRRMRSDEKDERPAFLSPAARSAIRSTRAHRRCHSSLRRSGRTAR